MLEVLKKSRQYLWEFVELAFLVLLALILVYLILGPSSGYFVLSVVENVTNFANGLQASSIIAFAIILALVYLVRERMR